MMLKRIRPRQLLRLSHLSYPTSPTHFPRSTRTTPQMFGEWTRTPPLSPAMTPRALLHLCDRRPQTQQSRHDTSAETPKCREENSPALHAQASCIALRGGGSRQRARQLMKGRYRARDGLDRRAHWHRTCPAWLRAVTLFSGAVIGWGWGE
jgi:hypothetical protein